jgi:predicted nucleotidyltransferase
LLAGGATALYLVLMDRQSVIAILKQHQVELQRQGVQHAALFGSIARGDARPDSDYRHHD